MRLQGKTALITGGSSGIGLAAARLFIKEGANVTITGRVKPKLEAAQNELGEHLLAVQADAGDVAALDVAVKAAVEKFGKLDIVFANAGVPGATPVGATEYTAFQNIININLTAVFFTVQAAATQLNEGASIILNGSVHAVASVPGRSAYAASKGAVRSMTRCLASEFAPREIRVNQVTPGATRTPIWESLASDAQAMEALEARLKTTIPLGRLAEPEDVARAVLYLASDDSKAVTATEIVVDGGATGAPLGAPAHFRDLRKE
jgi:NAD(P)-dependent dehydrogenase (short-subunit alcohol dehydrogenase family)